MELLDVSDRGDTLTITDAKGQPRLADAIDEVTIIGNTTRHAETTNTQGGHTVVGLGVALNERFRTQS